MRASLGRYFNNEESIDGKWKNFFMESLGRILLLGIRKRDIKPTMSSAETQSE